jgi:hypothetical protein
MASTPNDPGPELNPYAPPEAELGGVPVGVGAEEQAAAEATRRKYLGHEASVRSVGSLHYLFALFSLLGAAGLAVFLLAARGRPRDGNLSGLFGTLFLFYLALGALNVTLGVGLTRLRPWARWTEASFVGLYLIVNLFGTLVGLAMGPMGPVIGPQFVGTGFVVLILGYILYLVLSEKGRVVFSPEYQDVIARTPHIRYRTSCLVKGLLAMLVAFIALAIFSAFLLGTRR